MPSDYLKALHTLRTLFVQVRRRNVADSVRHDLPAGNEQRLIQTQNAIAAVDAAILDEERLAAWGEEDRTMFDVEGKVAADGAMNGIRIEAHHHGNGHGDQPAPAEDGTAGAKYFNGASTWRSYEAWRRSSRAD